MDFFLPVYPLAPLTRPFILLASRGGSITTTTTSYYEENSPSTNHHATIIYHARQFKFFFKTYSEDPNSYQRVESVIDIETFERIESRVLEVEIDEEISKLEGISERITDSLTKLYKIKKQKNDRQEREGLLTE